MAAGEHYNLRSKGHIGLADGLNVKKEKGSTTKVGDPDDRVWCQFMQLGNRRCKRMFYPPPFWSTACYQHRDKVDHLWR
jgi:hypothetical protein